MGINSSTYINNGNGVGRENDAYLYSTASQLWIGNGTQGPDGNLYIFAGGMGPAARADLFISSSGKIGIGDSVTASFGTENLKISGSVFINGLLVVSGSTGGGVFSKSTTLADLTNGISNSGSYMIWRAPYSASVQAVYGYREGGGSAQVNSFRSSSAGIQANLASNITLSTAATWTAGGTPQNADFKAGDSLFFHISGSAGNTQISVQVDFVRKF
jgi:hypothetical protein